MKVHIRDENKRERERAAPENPPDPDEEPDEDPSSDSSAWDGDDDEDPDVKEERKKLKKVEKTIKMLQAKLTEQSSHDGRYYRTIDAKVPHQKAWYEEKERRRAAVKRAEEEIDSRMERIRMERNWHERHDAGEIREEEYIPAPSGPLGVDTEYMSETGGGTIQVESGRLVAKSKARAMAAA